MRNHYRVPFEGVLGWQIMILVFAFAAFICILENKEFIVLSQRLIFYTALSFISIVDVVILILSLLKWWNIPIKPTTEGIIKKGVLYKWSEFIRIEIKPKSHYFQHLFGKVCLFHESGRKIYFGASSLLTSEIRKICNNTIITDEFDKNPWF